LIRCALDIGTNSSLFLLAEVEDNGRIHPRRHEVRTNDLGRGLDAQNRLTDATIALNLELLRDFRRVADEGGARDIIIAGTEALRRAANAAVLMERAQNELGLMIRIISGEEEAALTYLGVISGLLETNQPRVVADVGGGSTEIILGRGHRRVKSESLPLGAVSLDRQYIKHDPPSSEEIEAIKRQVGKHLAGSMLGKINQEAEWIICGGTASALASADLGLTDYQPERIAGHQMTRARLERFIHQFCRATLEERRGIPGIGRRRAEIILPGSLIIHELMKAAGIEAYQTSERGLRYGLLLTGAL